MTFHFERCDKCTCKFRVKNLKKPYVGLYRDNPVFHWFYSCPDCGHRHTVRFYNQFINTYYDKVMHLNFELWLSRKDEEKCDQLKVELHQAENELEEMNNRINNIWGL